jgi:photosystem II stability/assembly factor-like uncharacterized protein
MLLRSTRAAFVSAVLIVLAPVAAARAASIWTPLTSGTSQTISAIAWPTANTLVFTTTGGQILHQSSPSVFTQSSVTPAAPLGFTDVAMSPDGTHGVAVGPHAALYYSHDSGVTWNKDTLPTEDAACGQPTNPVTLVDDLYSVQFADANTVYVTGDHEDILKSTDGGATFHEVNKAVVAGSVQCKEMQSSAQPSEPFTDTAWIDANNGFLLNRYFGDLWVTTDGVGSIMPNREAEILDSYVEIARLSLDHADPSRLWAVSASATCGEICFMYSTDSGASWNHVNYDGASVAFRDVASSGTTVVVPGDGGAIYTSADGINFTRQAAPAPLTANNWDAAAVLNGTTAIVGGAGGALVVTQQANQLPDTTAPTGTISGPHTLATGQFGTYTLNATDNPGGSGIDPNSFSWSIPGQVTPQTGNPVSFAISTPGTYTLTVSFKDLAGNPGTASITIKVSSTSTGSQPVTKGAGGSTVTIFKKVTAGQGKGRFIPVKLATKKPRRFIVTLLTKNGKHQLATITTTLKKGHKTVDLRISSKIKSGSYQLVVIVLTTGKHSHPVGGRIRQVFVLS